MLIISCLTFLFISQVPNLFHLFYCKHLCVSTKGWSQVTFASISAPQSCPSVLIVFMLFSGIMGTLRVIVAQCHFPEDLSSFSCCFYSEGLKHFLKQVANTLAFFCQHLVSGVCTVATETRQKAFRADVCKFYIAPREDVYQTSSVSSIVRFLYVQ